MVVAKEDTFEVEGKRLYTKAWLVSFKYVSTTQKS